MCTDFVDQVEYTATNDSFWTIATVFFVLAMVLVAILWLVALLNFNRKSTRTADERVLDFALLFRAVVLLWESFARVFFWYLIVFTGYYFVFFKLQDEVFTLLPSVHDPVHDDYRRFELVLIMVVTGQVLSVANSIWRQCTVDIFFVDWEKPRGHMLRSGQQYDADNQDQRSLVGGADPAANDPPHDPEAGKHPQAAPISVWRTIFVANEWSELQIERRIHVGFTLLLLVVILEGADLVYLATPQPQATELEAGQYPPAVRNASTHNP